MSLIHISFVSRFGIIKQSVGHQTLAAIILTEPDKANRFLPKCKLLSRKTSIDQNRMSDLTPFNEFARRIRETIAQSCIGKPPDDTEFSALALELFRLQSKPVAPLQSLCRARGVSPETIHDWRDIPAMPTTAFKELELTCIPPEQRTAVFHSSGTTEQRPSRHFHCKESLALYEASLLAWFERCAMSRISDTRQSSTGSTAAFSPALPGTLSPTGGERRGEGASGFMERDRVRGFSDALKKSTNARALTILSLTPPATAVPHSSLAHMFDVIARRHAAAAEAGRRAAGREDARESVSSPRRLRRPTASLTHDDTPDASRFFGRIDSEGAWELDFEALLPSLVNAANASGPVVLMGTAFSFVHLLDRMKSDRIKLQLPPGSLVMETGGYKGRSRVLPKFELHKRIRIRFGVATDQVLCEYGMSELSSQAYDSGHRASDACRPGALTGRDRSAQSERDDFDDRPFQFPPWARAVIVSPETGKAAEDGAVGLIRVYDLANVYSVMAVQTSDLAVKRGDRFELIGRFAGAEPRGCSLMTVDENQE